MKALFWSGKRESIVLGHDEHEGMARALPRCDERSEDEAGRKPVADEERSDSIVIQASNLLCQ